MFSEKDLQAAIDAGIFSKHNEVTATPATKFLIMDIIEYIKSQGRALSMAEISDRFPRPQKAMSALVKSGRLKKEIYCFGSGGFDGLGFRTRAWVHVYRCV